MSLTRLFASLGVLLLAYPVWAAAPNDPEDWDATYEANPLTTDSATQGDDHIRDAKIQTRRRLNVEHQFSTIQGSSGTASDDDGLHRMGSARCFIKDTAPTRLEMDAYDNDTGADLVNGELLATASSALACNPLTSDCSDAAEYIGNGRCWFDRDGPDNENETADDYTLYVYDDRATVEGTPDTTAGWELASGAMTLGPNLLYNGDFEVDGDAATDPPTGWTTVGDGTLDSVQATDATEGTGYSITLSTAGGAGGISQAVILDGSCAAGDCVGTSTNRYAIIARVLPTTGDTCVLDQSGAASERYTPVSSTAVNDWQTLYGEFTTVVSALDTVTISLGATNAADICEWDHVAVHRINPPKISVAGDFLGVHTDTQVTELDDDPGDAAITTTDAYIAPSNGCYIKYTTEFAGVLQLDGITDFVADMIFQLDTDGDAFATDMDTIGIGGDTTLASTPYVEMSHVMLGYVENTTAGSVYTARLYYDYTSGGATGSRSFTLENGQTILTEFNCPGD